MPPQIPPPLSPLRHLLGPKLSSPAAGGPEGWPIPAETPFPQLQQSPFPEAKLLMKRTASS